MLPPPIFFPAGSPSNLTYTLWEAVGLDAANITLANDANGFLQVTFSANTARSYIRPIEDISITNGSVRAICLVEGWNTTDDQLKCGPGIRMSGTNATNNMSGYYITMRRYGNLSAKSFVWRMGEVTAGVVSTLATDSAAISGGLLTNYSDMTVTLSTSGANADISCSCKKETSTSPEFTATSTGDTTPRTGTDIGIAFRDMRAADVVRIKFFSYEST